MFCVSFGSAVLAVLVTNPAEPTPVASVQRTANRVCPADGMVQVLIPAGVFAMGVASHPDARPTDQPQHLVQLDAYWIDQTPVTNAMFARFVQATSYQTEAEKVGSGYAFDPKTLDWEEVRGAEWRHPHGPSSDVVDTGDHPVVQVTWADANAYCQWAGRRLPTEAEWEKAGRGTDARTYPWGDTDVSGNRANFADRNLKVAWSNGSVDDGYAFTAPVTGHPAGASPYGVLGMAGNVWQWLADWYDADYYAKAPKRNPAGPPSGESRVARGGAWGGAVRDLRAWHRGWAPPGMRADGQGFRCAQ